MDINVQSGGRIPLTLPGARSADTPVVKKDTVPAPAVPDPATAVPDVEAQRVQKLQQAARQFFDDVYAVSDTTFSIFKDATGQYVTRFTSLRDGRVTYIPEPKIIEYASRRLQAAPAAIEIEV